MNDLRIVFDGGNDTRIDFSSSVSGKSCTEQRVLINLLTDQGSDPLYSDRGTTLLQDSINGLAYDSNEAKHVANFAAIDTIFFVKAIDVNSENVTIEGSTEDTDETEEETEEETETEETTEEETEDTDSLSDIDMSLLSYSASQSTIGFTVTIKFTDDTETKSVADVAVTL